MKNKKLFLLSLLFIVASFLNADDSSNPKQAESTTNEITKINLKLENIPEIEKLNSRDPVFKSFTDAVEKNSMILATRNRKNEPELFFAKYKIPLKSEVSKGSPHLNTPQALASRFNIPYDTIVTLNEIANTNENLDGKTIIVPTVPGLFVSKNSKTPIQIILRNRNDLNLQNQKVWYNYKNIDFVFLENERFSPTERAYFLDSSLRLPIDSEMSLPIDSGLSWVSSNFGGRISPISGEWKTHKGIDLASPEGTPVKAIKDGKVSVCIKNDKTFGNYIILSHDDNKMTSVYAHLSKIAVSLNKEVKKGEVIGYVGQTGMATGPHLHFEVRVGGVAEDPKKHLPIK